MHTPETHHSHGYNANTTNSKHTKSTSCISPILTLIVKLNTRSKTTLKYGWAMEYPLIQFKVMILNTKRTDTDTGSSHGQLVQFQELVAIDCIPNDVTK